MRTAAACASSAILLTCLGAAAQMPPGRLSPEIAQSAPDLLLAAEAALTRFDPHAVELRLNDRRWQLWAGKVMLKDFAANRNAAYEARRLIAEMRLDAVGRIGTPEPVMEYWLSGGAAPPLPSAARVIVPFHPDRLRIIEEAGTFKVGDNVRVLYDFGPHARDAQLALAVLKRYEFNELGLIGEPTPVMTYPMRNNNERFQPPVMPASRGLTLVPQMAPRHPLDLAGLGRVGERRPFDPLRLEIVRSADGWRLVSGPHDLALLGNSDYQARTAMQIAQRYPFTEYVRIGTAGFGFFLSNGQPPRGVPLGVRSTGFQAKTLAVRQTGNQWSIGDSRQSLGVFNSAEEANLGIKVIQHYNFNCACEAGQGLRFLALDR